MAIPTVADFTSATMIDSFDDMISPPGLTNHWATVQVDHDVLALRSLNVPPLSQGDSVSGRLYLQGRLAESWGCPVEVTWRPDRVTRVTEIDQWRIETITVTPPGQPAAVVQVQVENLGEQRDLTLGVWVNSTATRSPKPWLAAEPPQEPNQVRAEGGMRWGEPSAGGVVSLQALLDADGSPVDDQSDTPRLVTTQVGLKSGASWHGAWVHILAEDHDQAARVLADVGADVSASIRASEQAWDEELRAIFTPGNDLYSGSLPELHTTNDALRTLYWWGALGTVWFRRDNPASVLGRTYDTLMPRYWQTTTFIWDYSLSSQVHSLLDPDVMRQQVAHWIGLDINSHFGTEWLTGGPVGYWYSVNQYAMIRLVCDYVRATGDLAFLDEQIEGPDGGRVSVLDHVVAWSLEWKKKATSSGLADYGGIDNLLECVSSYVHEVASLQAANVWGLRAAADLCALRDRHEEVDQLRREADQLLPLVKELYREGDGFFNARQPDGSLNETRHCYDFATVGTTIADDLPEDWRTEMVSFFDKELRSPSWMRALSPKDPDAGFSVRPDHQWNGAYPAWPADAARSLVALGGATSVADWLPGLARTSRQGPPGQAHFVEEAAPTVEGGARKAPGQYPYLIDWSCSSAGSWCELVIGSIFGLEIGVDGAVRVNSNLEHFDPEARLEGLVVRGTHWSVDADGVHRQEP